MLWTIFIIIVALILPVLSFGADIWIYVEGNSVAHKIFWLSRQPKLTMPNTETVDGALMLGSQDSGRKRRQINESSFILDSTAASFPLSSLNLTSLIPTEPPTTVTSDLNTTSALSNSTSTTSTTENSLQFKFSQDLLKIIFNFEHFFVLMQQQPSIRQ